MFENVEFDFVMRRLQVALVATLHLTLVELVLKIFYSSLQHQYSLREIICFSSERSIDFSYQIVSIFRISSELYPEEL